MNIWGFIIILLVALPLAAWMAGLNYYYRRHPHPAQSVVLGGKFFPALTWLHEKTDSFRRTAARPRWLTFWGNILAGMMAALACLPPLVVFWGRWLNETLYGQYPWTFVCLTGACVLSLVILAFFVSRLPSFSWPVRTYSSSVGAGPRVMEWLIRFLLIGTEVVLLAAISIFLRGEKAYILVGLALMFWLTAWVLPAVPLNSVLVWLRARRKWGPYLLFWLVLIPLSIRWASQGTLEWWSAALLILAALPLALTARTLPLLAWLPLLSWGLGMFHINFWLYSTVGDEYEFYTIAIELLKNNSFTYLAESLFRGLYAYGSHPFLSTLVQAAWMAVFGTDSAGWRSFNPFLCAAALPFFYFALRTFFNRRAALAAVFLLAVSSYLINFSKIGYNNLQAYFLCSLVLASIASVLRWHTDLAFVGLGVCAGLCLYTYPVALYLFFPLGLFLGVDLARRRWREWRGPSLSGATLFIFLLPLLFQPEYWFAKIAGTFAYNQTLLGSISAFGTHFLTNLYYAFLAPLFLFQETHFVVVSLLDPLSGALFLLGLGLFIASLRQSGLACWWGAVFLGMLILVGASHDREFPPITRLFILMPWFASFGGLAVDWLMEKTRARTVYLAAAGMFLLIGLNAFQAYQLSQTRNTAVQTLEVSFLRTAQKARQVYPGQKIDYLFISTPDWGIDGLTLMRQAYPADLASSELYSVGVDSLPLPDWSLPVIRRPNTVVVIAYRITDELARAVEPLLNEDKQRCAVRSADGVNRLLIWVPKSLLGLCSPEN